MRCGRCGASMFKTELYLSEALVKLKTVLAWRCDKCGRVEYYSCQSRQAMQRFEMERLS
jgi:predicted nucleic-acid-binding Zn-ribbon protein